VAISAGMGGMSPLRVAFGGALSMVVWNGLLLYVGMLLGQNWSEVAVLLKQYNRILLGVLATVAIVLVVRWFRKA
jgi:membrane protein DedA with SNARE-associated domain